MKWPLNDKCIIVGQGGNEGVVKMDPDGKLSFTDLQSQDPGQVFARRSSFEGNVLCAAFESNDYKGRYIVADTRDEDFTVSGKIVSKEDAACWRVRSYSWVTGDIMHFKGEPWSCLQYWGDVRYRKKKKEDSLFLVAQGKGEFTLGSYKQLIQDKNGIFSILTT